MAQIKKKFLASNAVDGTKVQFSNNESFRVKSTSNVDVELFKLDNSNLFQFLQMPRVGSDPSHGNDVSRKSYVDAQVLAEAASRVQADAAETAAREAAIASEAAARQSADEQLASDLASEVSNREAAVSAEATAREEADTALQTALDALEVSFVDSMAAEVAAREAADASLQSSIDAEQSRAEAAEADLQSQIDAMDTGNAAALAAEVAARTAADADLQSQVNTEKGRIDAILLASDADKDSFAEIVNLINSVDTENDSAFASYVLSNNAALAQEVSDRQAGDSALQSSLDAEVARATAAESDLQDAIDAEEQARMAAVSAEQAARESADSTLDAKIDQEIADREAAVSAEATAREEADTGLANDLAQEINDRQAAVSAEQSARESADSDLQAAIDDEVAARQSAVSGEEAARMAADSGIQSELDATQTGAGLGVDGSYSAPVGSQHLGSASSLKDADSKLDAAIVAESNARQTAVSNLEQSISDLDAAMSQGFDDAQAYTDQKVSDLINGAPALLDTLKELADAIGNDENFAGNILTAVSNETAARQAADTAEANARSAADSDLQAAIDQVEVNYLEAIANEQSAREAADAAESEARTAELPRPNKVRYTLTSTDVSNGYVDLDHIAMDNSCQVFIDRLACHEADDYTLSTVDGLTRVTFSAGFMSSEEGPGEGDLFRCNYLFKWEDQP